MNAPTATDPEILAVVKIPQWLQRDRDLATRVIEVTEIIRSTAKAVQVRGRAFAGPSDSCHRCGQTIENPVSILVGYGPICSDYLGIPRDFPEEQIDAIRAQVHAVPVETWIPRSAITIASGSLDAPVPARSTTPTDDAAPTARYEGPTDGDAPEVVYDRDGNDYDASPQGPVQTSDVARLSVVGDRVHAKTPFRLKDAVKAVPGARWDKTAKAWTYPATTSAALALRDALSGTITVRSDEAFADLYRRAAAAATNATAAKDAAAENLDAVPNVGTTGYEHWDHQRRSYWFARDLDAAMLAIGMGGGKSRVAVDLVCSDPTAKRVLILCPKNVVGVWPKQFRLHADRPVDVIAPQRGPKGGKSLTIAKRTEQIVAAVNRHDVRDYESDGPDAHAPLVVAVNYESAWREPLSTFLLEQSWDLVLLDESHRIKSPGGRASMFVATLRTRARRRLALTGTPMPNGPLDIYAQYRFLDPGIFGTSFTRFKRRYAILRKLPTGVEIVDTDAAGRKLYQNQDELHTKMFSIAYRIADEELDAALGLEEPIHETRECDLGPQARRIYDELEADTFADLGDGDSISVDNKLTEMLRLQQLTSGHVVVDETYDEETGQTSEREVVEVDREKADLLADVIEDLPTNEPIVVVCRFLPDLDHVARVCEAQGRRYGELSGRRRDGLTEDATMSDEIDVIGVQIQAGGVGIDLTRAHYCVFYSVGFSLGDYDQILKRTHRPGQTHRVSYYHLVASQTIDETVYRALSEKRDVVEYVLAERAGRTDDDGETSAAAEHDNQRSDDR